VKVLLTFYYSPDAVDDLLYCDRSVDNKFWYGLGRLARIYVAADKYHIPVLKKDALSIWEDCLGDANHDILCLNHDRPEDSAETAAKEDWQNAWESHFPDLTEAIAFLLEHTCDDDDIRKSLLDIEWARFAVREDREHWLNIVERWPGYAVNLMAHQAEDDWIVDQALRVELARESAAKEKATAAKSSATASATSA